MSIDIIDIDWVLFISIVASNNGVYNFSILMVYITFLY